MELFIRFVEALGVDRRRPTYTGDDYHGCVVVTVPRSRRLYTRTEGPMAGVFAAIASG